jgi:hypothetical protein
MGYIGLLLFDLHRRDRRAASLVLHSRPCYCYKSSYDFTPEICQFHRSVSKMLMKDKCIDNRSIEEEKENAMPLLLTFPVDLIERLELIKMINTIHIHVVDIY